MRHWSWLKRNLAVCFQELTVKPDQVWDYGGLTNTQHKPNKTRINKHSTVSESTVNVFNVLTLTLRTITKMIISLIDIAWLCFFLSLLPFRPFFPPFSWCGHVEWVDIRPTGHSVCRVSGPERHATAHWWMRVDPSDSFGQCRWRTTCNAGHRSDTHSFSASPFFSPLGVRTKLLRQTCSRENNQLS